MKYKLSRNTVKISVTNRNDCFELRLGRGCPASWNKVPEEVKRTTNLNAFKRNLKKHYLKELGKANF